MGHVHQCHSFPPRPSIPCQSELVQGPAALFLRLSHIQAKAVAAFESRWEFIDGARKVILMHGGVLLLLDSFSLGGEERKEPPNM